jgi:hypothetical protein
MTETVYPSEASGVMATPDSKVLPKRNGTRSMLPSTWVGRSLRIEYRDAFGKGQKTSATLLDWCSLGIVVDSYGAKAIIPWERLGWIELVPD